MRTLSATGSRQRTVVLLSGFAIVIALFAAMLIRWPGDFFADDSFFYFQVAWNLARGCGSTFNNVIPTNGYHPLWMLVCVVVFKLLPAKAAALHGIGAAIALFDAGALALLVLILKRVAPGLWWVALFVYAPFCFLTQLGTEGALSGFFLAALVLATYALCTGPSGAKGALFALCGTLAVLSRLDNIFIVGLIYLAVFATGAPVADRRWIRRILLNCIPIYLLFWGAYLGCNLHWFGTIQPISGMLKAHPNGEVREFHSPPHIAAFGLIVILPSVLLLARFCRDMFFRVVELPFAAGVLVHAAYIALVMSSETRWSWYYTSWILLASILLSRILWLVLKQWPRVCEALAAVSLMLLLAVWYEGSYRRFIHPSDPTIATYEANLSGRLHLHTVLAFDQPGRTAYYTDVHVVALDGLMGDLQFQRDLATKGIAAFVAEHDVDGFIGPPQPLDADGRKSFCEQVHLSSTRFHCTPSAPGEWNIDRVEVFARLTGDSAGSLPLPQRNLVWSVPYHIAVWRIARTGAERH
jgi:hypothetical protein